MKVSPEFESPSGVTKQEENLAFSQTYSVVQHNALVQQYLLLDKTVDTKTGKEIRTPFSLSELKLFYYLISRIKPGVQDFERMEIIPKQYYEVFGEQAENGDNYSRLKDAVDTLYRASFVLYDRPNEETEEIRILSLKLHRPKKGTITVKLNNDLQPYLTNLINNYTQYSIHNILCMKSKYGLMLYQLLKSYQYFSPRIRFTVDDLKGHLAAETYKNFANFKTKVIAPALEDINKYTDLQVSVEYTKTGRSFSHVTFIVKDLGQTKSLEADREYRKRYKNVEQEINPGQMILDDYFEGDSEGGL